MADQEARFIQLTTDLLNKFDANKDGSLSKEEFGACLKHFGEKFGMGEMPQEMVDMAFAGIDENSDNRISMEEFQKSIRAQVDMHCATEESYAAIRAQMDL